MFSVDQRMECCDSVSNNGASGPHTQQPPGHCRPLAPSPLILAKEQDIHLSTVTLSKQGGQVGRTEEEELAERCEDRIREKQVNECSNRELFKDECERKVEEDEGEGEGEGEEHPIGEILYQRDGSAYITERESQLTRGVPSSSLGAPSSVISTCYISSSQSLAPQVFHVFHLHHLDNSDSLALVTRQSKDSAPDMAGISEAWVKRCGLTKPILMCFLCRLSFGRSHTFRAHASRQHNITFSDEEQHLLSFKHTSAILQPAGPGGLPLLCFLEPKNNCESVVPLNPAPPTSGNSTKDTTRRKDNKEAWTSKPDLPLLPSTPRISPATSEPSPAKDPSTLGREGTQKGKEDERWKDGAERRMCLEEGSTVDNSAHSISSSSRQEHSTEAALSNQSISKSPNSATIATSFTNNTKTLTDSESECGTSFNCHEDPAPASLVVVNPPTVTSTEQLDNQESATAAEPNDQLENGSAIAMEPTDRLFDDDSLAVTHSNLPNNNSHSTSHRLSPTLAQTSQSVLEEGHSDTASKGRLVVAADGGFFAVADDVQGSSYTYGIQASMAHTRNSCKTLKCPKCNWHYKYQQTLEAHMKEKHPESESEQCPYCSSRQSHPRLARGETYSCGYKPFRCQVCQYSTTTKGNLSIHMQSDKHLINMQSLQTQSKAHTPAALPSPLSHSHPTITHPTQANSPSPSKLRGRASWRCEVCDYETNVARNLRIHMTSEKHTHNVLLLQQNLAHMQRQRKHKTAEIYRHCQPQTNLSDSNALLPSNEFVHDSSQKLFECILCSRFSCDTLEQLSQHLTMQRSLPNAYWRSTTGDTHHCQLCHYATPLRANFQLHCQTDKHVQRYQLAAHLREASSYHGNIKEEEEEWRLRCVTAGNQLQLRCNACDYEANSIEKLKLHTMNSRHETSLRLYKYLQQMEGVESEGVWLHCVLCDFSTQNRLSLVQHSHSLGHQRGEGLLRIQQIQKGLQDDEELSAIFTIRKSPTQENGDHNGMESPTEITANLEDRNKHGDRAGKKKEAIIQTEVEQNESSSSPKRPSSGSSDSDDPSPCKRPRGQEEMQCPFCLFRHSDIESLRTHVMNQHAVQPALRCPLCQDILHSIALLRTHLTNLHSVTADCTQKLINTVIASDVLPEKMFLPVQNSDTQQTMAGLNANETKRLDEISTDAEPERGSTPQDTAKIHKQPSEDAESTKENSAAFPCWQKSCNKVFTSSSALQTHFNQLHSQKSQMPISDRHIYKYRCNQCSLAFKTPEKLQMHSQYHAIRAATMCCLCQRSFRTMQALRKHLETSHLELSESQIQQIYGGLMMNGESGVSVDQGFEDQGSPEENGMRDDEECDLEEKLSVSDNDSGLGKDSVECDLKQPVLPLRKGPNITVEKFMDPSRPFKCTVCKESFTQNNILLVHYNSVSHLHKLKRSLQDTSNGFLEPINSTDHKPFKCSICNVAYSQSSTLEIHMRSVLHQTKARGSKLNSSNSTSESNGPFLDRAVSNTPTDLKPMTSMNNLSLSHQHKIEPIGTSANPDTSHSSTSEVRKKLVDIIDSATKQQQMLLQQQPLQQQQQLVQAQAHLQQELQKNATILQSHLFNPALLHPFPMATEALLPVQQQQQLLLPFLIPGGDFCMNPELSLKGSGVNLSTLKPTTNDTTESSKKDVQTCFPNDKQNVDQTNTDHQTPSEDLAENYTINEQKLASNPQCEKSTDGNKINEESKEMDDMVTNEKIDNPKYRERKDLNKEVSVNGELVEFFPPRIAHDAPGNASKALLENIGFELVMQFNENKQRYQKNLTEMLPNDGDVAETEEADNSEDLEKLECGSCRKLFSNALILKSHKEQIHHSIFPIKSLEKFANEYREQYDKHFPLKLATPEASPPVSSPSPSLPTPLPSPVQEQQQQVQPIIPTSTRSATPAAVSISQVKASVTQIPLPMELTFFPPLLMPSIPLQALTPQVPVHLPPVEAGLPPDLTQLYQQQLTPAMLEQQSKRPRTRIMDDQLRILRQYFDINNSPNEDQIHDMANKSGLPHKVIKHWFRNTLFKERQRNKDSPYNFSNPPITTLEDVKMDSKPPSPDPPRQECYGGKRSSRTRFTDYQLRVLQDFFDANAYPKDDEFEQLSNLLNLSTRVIVVWFQNARQKARKNYENQGEGVKDAERRDLPNDRYSRTANNNFQCKKCNVVIQCIFDLINHQKKQCYKDDDDYGDDDDDDDDVDDDDDEMMQNELNETAMDFKSECHIPISGPLCFTQAPFCSSPSSSSVSSTNLKSDSEQLHTNNLTGEFKYTNVESAVLEQTVSTNSEFEELENKMQRPKPLCEEKQNASTEIPSHSSPKQQQLSCTSQTSPVPSHSSPKMFSPSEISSSEQQKLAQEMSPYHCIQCKLSFPSFEHWQEHQQMHLVTQSYFPTPQFLDRPVDIPLMLFDPSNPLLARHLLSGTIPQIAVNPDSTINSLKRKLEEKAGSGSVENDWENNGDEPQRDKRMRTTITPEQLEVLYQKYLLDSNPTRKMLDHISNEVGLKKRVVQVWFQNTRARERKGQFRALGPTQMHRRCPFCRALFKAQTALAAHIRSRHWHEARNSGYSMAISSMTQDQECSQIKADCFDFANYPQFFNLTNDLYSPESKSMDLSSHQQRLSPKPMKGKGIEDFEIPSMSVFHQTFEQRKLNKCEATTNMTHDEGNDSLDGTHGNMNHISLSTEREGSSENDEKMSAGLISPAMSFNAKDFDNDLVLDYSENSSLADPASPCPGSSNSQGFDNDRYSQKRYRTQMTNLQVKVLKACFSDYKTPTMLECEALGNDIGLAKRVVQVWFQNSRAKERKAKISLAKHFGIESTSIDRPKTECTLCSVKYIGCFSIRDHVFSQQHLAKVKEALGGQMERDKEHLGSVSARQLMAQQELDNLKKTSDVLGLNQTAIQCLNQSSMYSSQQTNASASIQGGSSTMMASFSSMKTVLEGASDPPAKPPVMSSSAISAMDDKDVVSTTNSVLTSKITQQEHQLQFPKENDTESNKIPMNIHDSTPLENSSCNAKEKLDSSRLAVSTPNTGREYAIDPFQLQALHGAMKTDPGALLSSSLMPCLMPGFPPLFSPHIPTPMPSGLLQPMFGMDGIFPYVPVFPQALLGLSPGSLLQQYQQNLQGALMQQRMQLQQKQLVQLPEKPKPSQDTVHTRGPVLDLSKHDKKQGTPNGTDSPFINSKQPELNDNILQSHCIVSKAVDRGEGKDCHLNDCLACEESLAGHAELMKHLKNPQQKQSKAERLNAKEHASPRLPHISPSSTSQPNPPSDQSFSSAAQSSSETSIPTPTNSDQSSSDRRCSQSSSQTSALSEASQSSPASHHVLSPSNVTSSLTSLAKACHEKPTDSVDACCDSDKT